jgi:hypothetical protein
MHDRDSLHRFMFEHYPIRGHLVHLDASWRALIEHREYPDAIRTTLGEAVVASLLLAATIKFEGVLSLQLQGAGPGAPVVGAMHERTWASAGSPATARNPDISGNGRRAAIGDLIGAGNLTVTVETMTVRSAIRESCPSPASAWRFTADLLREFRAACRRACGCTRTKTARRACCCSGCRARGCAARRERVPVADGAADRRCVASRATDRRL